MNDKDALRIARTVQRAGASSVQIQVLKLDTRTGRRRQVGELPCPEDESENLRDIIESVEWGGPGDYLLFFSTADGKRLDNVGSHRIIIDEDEEEKRNAKRDRQEKTKVDIHKINKMLEEDLETYRLLNLRKKLEKALEDDEEEEEGLSREEIIAEIDSILKEKNAAAQQPQTNEFVQYMMAQQDQARTELSQQREQFQQLLVAVARPPDNGGAVIAEMIKAQSAQFLAVMERLMQPRESGIEKALERLAGSPLAAKVVDSILNGRESAIDKVLPVVLEKTTGAFNNFTEKAATTILENAFKPPPIDPKDELQQKLAFLRGLKELIMPSMKELIAAFAEMKRKDTAGTPSGTTLPAKREKVDEHVLFQKIQRAFTILVDNREKSAKEILAMIEKDVPDILPFFKETPREKILTDEVKNALGAEAFARAAEVLDALKGDKQ